MYRELLDEFVKMANEVSAEELEVIAEAALVGLDKMADAELDKLEKMADAFEAMEKNAEVDAGDVLGGLGGLTAGIGAMYGLKKIKGKIPEWKIAYKDAQKAKYQAKAEIANVKAKAASNNAQKARDEIGFTTAGGSAAGKGGFNGSGNGPKEERYNKYDIKNRLKDEHGDANLLIGDAKALQTKDWINKNKNMVLAGVGGAALLGNSMIQNNKKDAELAGAYNAVGGFRR